jgi:hypothetical protein
VDSPEPGDKPDTVGSIGPIARRSALPASNAIQLFTPSSPTFTGVRERLSLSDDDVLTDLVTDKSVFSTTYIEELRA